VGNNTLSLNYTKAEDGVYLELGRSSGSEECTVEFRPAISLRAKVQSADLNGKSVQFQAEPSSEDQHVVVRIPVSEGRKFLRIYVVNDFGVSMDSSLPSLGGTSQGLRVLSQSWSAAKDQLTLDLSGLAGSRYSLKLWNAAQLQRVEGGELSKKLEGATVAVQIPRGDLGTYARAKLAFYFTAESGKGKKR
jgi:hypothetical protein